MFQSVFLSFTKIYRISDNVFLPGQPSYDVPNDAYETVHLPKHDILEESLKREV